MTELLTRDRVDAPVVLVTPRGGAVRARRLRTDRAPPASKPEEVVLTAIGALAGLTGLPSAAARCASIVARLRREIARAAADFRVRAGALAPLLDPAQRRLVEDLALTIKPADDVILGKVVRQLDASALAHVSLGEERFSPNIAHTIRRIVDAEMLAAIQDGARLDIATVRRLGARATTQIRARHEDVV